MKKTLLSSISGMWVLMSTAISLNGQIASNHVSSTPLFIKFNQAETENSSYVSRVNPPVIRNFLKTYRDVSDEKWIEVNNGFVALFNYKHVDYQVAYSKKGSLLRTIRSYSEDDMPPDLRHIVKSTYYDYQINRVHEIEIPLTPLTYVVQLIGKKELINLAIDDGEMEVLQQFNLSK